MRGRAWGYRLGFGIGTVLVLVQYSTRAVRVRVLVRVLVWVQYGTVLVLVLYDWGIARPTAFATYDTLSIAPFWFVGRFIRRQAMLPPGWTRVR